MQDLTNHTVTFTNRQGVKLLALVTDHDTDTNMLTVHTAVNAATLKPFNFRFGGKSMSANNVTVVNL